MWWNDCFKLVVAWHYKCNRCMLIIIKRRVFVFIGAKEAWLKIQKIDESACIHRLMALEGAIEGVKKTMLSDEVKADLKEFYQRNKR